MEKVQRLSVGIPLGGSPPKWRAPKAKAMVNDIVYTCVKMREKLFVLIVTRQDSG